jgi:hypothetical protein
MFYNEKEETENGLCIKKFNIKRLSHANHKHSKEAYAKNHNPIEASPHLSSIFAFRQHLDNNSLWNEDIPLVKRQLIKVVILFSFCVYTIEQNRFTHQK